MVKSNITPGQTEANYLSDKWTYTMALAAEIHVRSDRVFGLPPLQQLNPGAPSLLYSIATRKNGPVYNGSSHCRLMENGDSILSLE